MSNLKGKRLTVYLPPEVWKRTQQLSVYYQLNFSQMISTLLWREYQKQHKNIEVLEKIFPDKMIEGKANETDQ
jgi:hypothetical protein